MLDEALQSAAAAKSGRVTHVLPDDSAPGRRLQDATFGLWRQHPDLSAAGGAVLWQRVAFAGVAALLLAGWLSWLEAERSLLAAILMATFICIIAVRCLVLWTILVPSTPPAANAPRLPDDHLPAYTVLVPVYCETEVAAQLIRSLAAIDYPADKLQILFICEEHDVPTHSALRHAGLAGNMRLVVVPDGQPRTKPRALNYALADATGDYVVVYDAEDEPEPDQLRKAVAIFRDGAPNLGCLQGQLKIYNSERCWLTRGIMAQTPQEVNPRRSYILGMNELGNRYALAALRDKRASIASEIVQLERQIRHRKEMLIHVDASLQILDPSIDVDAIALKRVGHIKLFRQGELGRMITNALREFGKPVNTSEVVTAILAQGGHGETARQAVGRRVRGNLTYLERTGRVSRAGCGASVTWALTDR